MCDFLTTFPATNELTKHHYDFILWNFPCVRAPKGADGQASEIEINKNLLRQFFTNAHSYLTPRGQLHIAHKTIEPFSWWGITDLARECGFRQCFSVVFDRCLYPGYVNRKVLDKKSFPSSDARVFVFVSTRGQQGNASTATTVVEAEALVGGADVTGMATALGLVRVVDELPSLIAGVVALSSRGRQGNKASKRSSHDTRMHADSADGTGGAGYSQQAKRTRPS